MELGPLIRNFVQRLDTGTAQVAVVKFPTGDRAIAANAACDIDPSGGPEVSPGELLFARPHQLHRFARRSRQARRFESGLPGVLAAVSGAGIGNDHAYP